MSKAWDSPWVRMVACFLTGTGTLGALFLFALTFPERSYWRDMLGMAALVNELGLLFGIGGWVRDELRERVMGRA